MYELLCHSSEWPWAETSGRLESIPFPGAVGIVDHALRARCPAAVASKTSSNPQKSPPREARSCAVFREILI